MTARTQRQTEPSTPTHKRRHRWRRRLAVVFALVAVLLVAGRLALPGYIQTYVNRVIDQSTQYDGRIGRVQIALWRGAYTIHDISIVKTTDQVPVPFFECPKIDISLNWRSLLHGELRGEITMDQPRINFVDGPSADESQTGADQAWLQMLNDLSPFRLEKAEIRDGEVHFNAFHTTPAVDVYLTQVQAELENLTNVQNKLDPLMAKAHATALAMNDATVELNLEFDPQAYRPTFSLAVRLLDLDVTTLNALSMAYGGFDFETGYFDFVLEASAKDGFLEGNVKPLFRDIDIASLSELREDGLLRTAWEAAIDTIEKLLTNPMRNQFGTSFTVRGDLDAPKTNLMEIIGNVLRNAFVRAFLPRFEGIFAPESVDLNRPKEKS